MNLKWAPLCIFFLFLQAGKIFNFKKNNKFVDSLTPLNSGEKKLGSFLKMLCSYEKGF